MNKYVTTGRRRLRAFLATTSVVIALALVAGVAAMLITAGGRGGRKAATTPRPHASKSPSVSPSPTANPTLVWTGRPSDKLRLKLRTVIGGYISPKSVVATQTGLVFAQNMMYRHTITVYDTRTFKLKKTISDAVELSKFGLKGYSGTVQGGPVEAAVSVDGAYMYVSNYSIWGPGFDHQGGDIGGPGNGVDPSFLYRVDLKKLKIDQVIKVGSVPKYVAVTPDGKYVLVSNWISYTLSVVDIAKHKQIRQLYLGPYPRGIAVDPKSRYAYVAVMGSYNIAKVDLKSFTVAWINGVGSAPRHVVISPDGHRLYATLNGEGNVAKIDLKTRKVIDKVATGTEPRSMCMAADGRSLYVVNYASNTVSKIRTSDMKVLQVVPAYGHPIGITYDNATHNVWVACYSGSIMVFHDG
jgi:YVTN family beta-propeller protein